jgi:two-component system, chemotaxis family, protein-glutamate methylesterase/glutaminase
MSNHAIVVVGASAGGLDPLRSIIEALPRQCAASFLVAMHVGRHPSDLPDILSWHGKLPVTFGTDGAPIEPGHVYVAPPDHHMLVEGDHIRLSRNAMVHATRPAVDPLFTSAARSCGSRVVGVVLSGSGVDGAEGALAIKDNGGMAFALDPGQANPPAMPAAAIAVEAVEVLPLSALAREVAKFCSHLKEST